MARLYVDQFATFDDLCRYWKRAEQTRTPFRAVLLSTEIVGLDKKVTNFVLGNVEELNDMSGDSCTMFVSTPRKASSLFLPPNLKIRYEEISYSIGRLLGIPPDHFPAMVFFDTLPQPRQMVVISLGSILGQEPADEDIVTFFRSLFTITDNLRYLPEEKRLPALRKAVVNKWSGKGRRNANFVKVIETTLSLSEIAKNVVEIIRDIMLRNGLA